MMVAIKEYARLWVKISTL